MQGGEIRRCTSFTAQIGARSAQRIMLSWFCKPLCCAPQQEHTNATELAVACGMRLHVVGKTRWLPAMHVIRQCAAQPAAVQRSCLTVQGLRLRC